MVRVVEDPLKTTVQIEDSLIKYLLVIHDFNKKNVEPTNETISNHLGVAYSAAKSFFFRRKDFLKLYINYSKGSPINYSLNDKGRNLVETINYFKNYFRSFKLEECHECELDTENICVAKHPNECPLIRLGNHLHFKPEDV